MSGDRRTRRKRVKTEEGPRSDGAILWDEHANPRDFIEIPPQQRQLLKQERLSVLPPQPGKPPPRGSLPVKDLERISSHFSSGVSHGARTSTAGSAGDTAVSDHDRSEPANHSPGTETYSWGDSPQQSRSRKASVHSGDSEADSEGSSVFDETGSGYNKTIDEENAEMAALARPASPTGVDARAIQSKERMQHVPEPHSVNDQVAVPDPVDPQAVENNLACAMELGGTRAQNLWDEIGSISTGSDDEAVATDYRVSPSGGLSEHNVKVATQAAWISATQHANSQDVCTAGASKSVPERLESLRGELGNLSKALDSDRPPSQTPVRAVEQPRAISISPHDKQVATLGDFTPEGRLVMQGNATEQPRPMTGDIRSDSLPHRFHGEVTSSDNQSDEEPSMELEAPRRLTRKPKMPRTSHVPRTQPEGISPVSKAMQAQKAVSTHQASSHPDRRASHRDVKMRENPIIHVDRTPLNGEKGKHQLSSHGPADDITIPASIVPSSGLSPRQNTETRQGHAIFPDRERQPERRQHASPKRKHSDPSAASAPSGKRLKLTNSSALPTSSPDEQVPDPALTMRQEKAAFMRKASLERAKLQQSANHQSESQQSENTAQDSCASAEPTPEHAHDLPENHPGEARPVSPPPAPRAERPLSLYRRFRQAYPQYEAAEAHFQELCQAIRAEIAERGLHRSLWDDFVYQHFVRYAAEAYHSMRSGTKPLDYGPWYQDVIEEPECRSRILTPVTLDQVCPAGVTKSKVRSENSSPREEPKMRNEDERADDKRSKGLAEHNPDTDAPKNSSSNEREGSKSAREKARKSDEPVRPVSAVREEKSAMQASPPPATSRTTARTTEIGNSNGTPASTPRTLPWKQPRSPMGSTPRTQYGSAPRAEQGPTPQAKHGSTPSRKAPFSFSKYRPDKIKKSGDAVMKDPGTQS